MPFDPSKPFNKVSGFDPNKPFNKVTTEEADQPQEDLGVEAGFKAMLGMGKEQIQDKTSIQNTVVDQGLQGFSLGFADEAISATDALIAKLSGDKRDFSKIYTDNQTSKEKVLERQTEKHTATAIASNIAGGVVNPLNYLLSGAGTATKLGKAGEIIAKAGSNVVSKAAIEGAVYGAGVAGQDNRIVGAAQGAAAGAVLGSIPKLVGGTFKGAKNLVRKLKGETITDDAGKAAINVLGAGGKNAVAIADKADDVVETITRNDLMPNMLTSKWGIANNTNKAIKKSQKRLNRFWKRVDEHDLPKISDNELAGHLDDYAATINTSTKGGAKELKAVVKRAKELRKRGNSYTVKKAFDNKVQVQDEIFNNKVLNTDLSTLDAKIGNIERIAYDKALQTRVGTALGDRGVNFLQSANKNHSMLRDIHKVVTESRVKPSINFFDRLTIGAAIAGVRSPLVAAGLLGTKEAFRVALPKLQFAGRKAATPSLSKAMTRGAIRRQIAPVFSRSDSKSKGYK